MRYINLYYYYYYYYYYELQSCHAAPCAVVLLCRAILMHPSLIELAQHYSVINCDITMQLNIGSTSLPDLMVLQKFWWGNCYIKWVHFVLFWYIKHILTAFFEAWLQTEPTGISKPCMAPGASTLGHTAWFWDSLGLIIWTIPQTSSQYMCDICSARAWVRFAI